MIIIDKDKMEVIGTFDVVLDNLQFFFYNSMIAKKSDSDLVNELLSFDNYIRMMYTIASVNKNEFVNFLKVNQKILKDIQEGNFKLIFRDKGENKDE